MKFLAASLGSMLLVACGGGATSTSPAPTATLNVSANVASVPAGGQSVALSAVTANISGTVNWSLSGPGSLSATSGNQVNYVPPLPSLLGTATTATATATIGSLQQSIKVALSPAPGSTWQVAQPPVSDWRNVHYLNGRFYLVEREALLSSQDGVTWTLIPLPRGSSVIDVTLGSHGFVAVGDAGDALYSQDGTTWSLGTVSATPDSTGLDPRYLQISTVAFGNGVYVASGVQGVMTSTDGVNWLSSTAGVPYGMGVYQLAFGNGRFVAAAYPAGYTSTDGVAWSTPNVAGAGGVAFGNGLFVSVTNFQVSASPDGLTWVSGSSIPDINPIPFPNPPGVSFSAGRFYAYGNKGVDASTDGVNWSQVYALPGNNVNAMVTSVAASASDTVVVGISGLLQHSSDGTNWTSPAIGTNAALRAVDCMKDRCVAPASDGSVLTSIDTAHWSVIAIPGKPDLVAITHGNGLFVAAGSGASSGVIYTSIDGLQWTSSSTGTFTYLYGAAYGNGHFVVVGFNDTVLTSTDGVNWTATGTGITPVGTYPGLHAIAFGNGRFVVIDNMGSTYSSTDGSQWTAGPTGAPVGALTFGDSAGFVAVGDAGAVWRSADGITWSPGVAGTQAQLNAVTYGDSQYVAAGGAGTVLLSEDAVHWTARQVGVNPIFTGATFNGQSFVLVGSSGAIVTSLR